MPETTDKLYEILVFSSFHFSISLPTMYVCRKRWQVIHYYYIKYIYKNGISISYIVITKCFTRSG